MTVGQFGPLVRCSVLRGIAARPAVLGRAAGRYNVLEYAADLSQDADVLAHDAPWVRRARALPARLALVMGSEASGITPEARAIH
jgi:hypothetical protein